MNKASEQHFRDAIADVYNDDCTLEEAIAIVTEEFELLDNAEDMDEPE